MTKKLLSMLALLCLTVASAWGAKIVEITSDDLHYAEWFYYTRDGVTLSATEPLDESYIGGSITISTSEGIFTKIVITADEITISGDGWEESTKKSTWTGNASSVSFSGVIKYNIKIRCIIETTLSISPNTMQTFRVGESVCFTANTSETVKWSVGGTNASAIALYSDAGCTVSVGTGATSTKTVYAKGVSVGSATVIVTTSTGSQTASCDVNVEGYFVTANQADGAYWSTFYSNEANYQASEGTQVFAVNLDGDAIDMTEISDRIVVSGQGVVLKSTSGSITMTRTNAAPAGDFSGNSLTGTMSSLTNPGNAYVLNKGANGVGFYRLASSGTIGANKAYLTYSGSLVREFFLFEDDATGINEELRSFSSMKSMKNEESSIYNLAGQRVQKMQRGINVVNGKKVLK